MIMAMSTLNCSDYLYTYTHRYYEVHYILQVYEWSRLADLFAEDCQEENIIVNNKDYTHAWAWEN